MKHKTIAVSLDHTVRLTEAFNMWFVDACEHEGLWLRLAKFTLRDAAEAFFHRVCGGPDVAGFAVKKEGRIKGQKTSAWIAYKQAWGLFVAQCRHDRDDREDRMLIPGHVVARIAGDFHKQNSEIRDYKTKQQKRLVTKVAMGDLMERYSYHRGYKAPINDASSIRSVRAARYHKMG